MENDLSGKVMVMFDVTLEGAIDNVEVIMMGDSRDTNDFVKNKFHQLITSMPPWYPASQRGKFVPVRFVSIIRYAANGYGRKN